ncbi:hypothetical protein BKA70DRAFT_1196588 [Coprinopsis sp. MPI-PUGE-AT-0042]|nr:hypothetical protein BKA70DRAFT_1196588 [Coprinopsis sp. MPI-PUGE-AT-0042]
MPSLIVEDIAPFLSYSPRDWRLGTTDLIRSSGGSITATDVEGATVSFSFYGTGVGIYGSTRPRYGGYQVLVDGRPYEVQSGRSDREIWQQPLFTVGDLPKGDHTVVLRNVEAKLRDLDYFTWEPSIGNDDEPVTIQTVQDSHPSFTYDPPEKWTTDAPNVQAYSGGTGHATNHITATARLRFKVRTAPLRDAIALYGPAGNQAASVYTVRMNDRQPESFSASTFNFTVLRAQQLMYFGGNLGPGEHELVIQLGAVASAQQFLAIDYAEIYTTPSIGGDAPLAVACPNSSMPVGLIAAVAVTGSFALVCLALLIWIFVLVKKGKLRRQGDHGSTNHRPNPSVFSSVFNSDNGPTPGLVPVPYHVPPMGPESPNSPKPYLTPQQPVWNAQTPTSLSHSLGLPARHSNADTLTSWSSSPMGVRPQSFGKLKCVSESFCSNNPRLKTPLRCAKQETRSDGQRSRLQLPRSTLIHDHASVV